MQLIVEESDHLRVVSDPGKRRRVIGEFTSVNRLVLNQCRGRN